jgi:hypothetical protein
MIPTIGKAKLSRQLSYPLGAEAISNALINAPHYTELTVQFHDAAVYPGSEFRRALADGRAYRVLRAIFQPAIKPGFIGSNNMIAAGRFNEKWKLMVYPVIRSLRHVANQLLVHDGLRQVEAWLYDSQQPGWTLTPHNLEIVFHPQESSLSQVEI